MFYNHFFDEDENKFYDDDNWHQSHAGESLCFSDYLTSDTLILHPMDHTTDFLSAVYEGKKWDVIKDSIIEPEVLKELIELHDRIICLGHGSPSGLFGRFGYLIHDGLASLLKDKLLVTVWCHADQFINRHRLKGFYSGMFISELEEAWMYGIYNTDERAIAESNNLFSSALGKYIDSDNILENVKREYRDENDPVITFNHNRLYYR